MYQYDDPSASSTMPSPAAVGTPGYFTDGSAAAGVPATILRSDFMNMLMMELLNVVDAAGITPSKTAYNQLLTALNDMYARLAGSSSQVFSVANASQTSHAVALGQFGNSLATSGYQKLPSGLIIQWTTTPAIAYAGSYTWTFPIAFPAALIGANATPVGGNAGIIEWTSGTATSVSIGNNGPSGAASNPVFAVAIGY